MKNLSIEKQVLFPGWRSDALELLAISDVFASVSLREGLPMSLLEAMSIGLPCLSSPICGIPEILKPEYLYDFDDYEGFASGIEKFISNPQLMTEVSAENLQTAQKYNSSTLNQRRKEFYDKLKENAQSRK